MTLSRSVESAKWYVDPPPQGDDLSMLARWTHRHLLTLQQFLQRPEFAGVVFSQINTTVQPEFKAEDGLMLHVAAGVLGPQEGLYIRESGTWKKVT